MQCTNTTAVKAEYERSYTLTQSVRLETRMRIHVQLSHAEFTVTFWCQARRCFHVPNMSGTVPSHSHSQETRTWHFSHWFCFADMRGNWSSKCDWVLALSEGGRKQRELESLSEMLFKKELKER